MSAILYEVIGATITGGGGMETVCLCEEVRRGDLFRANGRWYRVNMAGTRERTNDETPGPTHVLDCEEMVLVSSHEASLVNGEFTPEALKERLDKIHHIICDKSNTGRDLELGSSDFISVRKLSDWRGDAPQ